MQRKALRATVGGVERDIPLGTFSDGQVMTYDADTNTFRGTAGGGGGGLPLGPYEDTQALTYDALNDEWRGGGPSSIGGSRELLGLQEPALTMYFSNMGLVNSLQNTLNRQVRAFTAYTDENNLTSNTFELTNKFTNGEKVVLSHSLIANGQSLATAQAGGYNALYDTCVSNLLPFKDRILVIRIGWEFNKASGYPWDRSAIGWSTANYVGAFRNFANRIRRGMPDVLIDWCPLWDQPLADAYYPGDDVVDIIGNDVYLGSAFWSDSFTNVYQSAPCSLVWQEEFSRLHNKFMSLPEWATDYDTGTVVHRISEWIMRPRVNRVLYHGYWNSDLAFPSAFATHPNNFAAYRAHFERT